MSLSYQTFNPLTSKLFFVFGCFLSVSLGLSAQRPFDNNVVYYTDSIGQINLAMPLLTMPAQQEAYKTTDGFFQSYMNPGMENSLAYSVDFYTAAHWGLKKAIRFKEGGFWQIFLQRMSISAFDVITMQMPLAFSWLHEEYHRGVMSQYGIDSYNEVLLFQLGASSIAVSHVKDAELAMLCDEHHPDFVRLMSAGHEAVVDLNRNLQSNEFFYHQNLDNEVLYWMTSFQNLIYIMSCANGDGDAGMKERNAEEIHVRDRDFTGMDMNAWIDALWNPTKPYANRGLHPSGNGINRYIMTEDLPDECVDYLHRQTRLDILNFVSPMLFGFSRFRLAHTERGAYYGNFAFRHYLTAFGDDAALDLYLQAPRINLYATLHCYNNYEYHFGGLEFGLIDYPVWDNRLLVGGTFMGWVQPEDMLFRTATGSVGGLAKVRVCYAGALASPYLELGWKSKGWVAGNANLGDGFFMKAGLRWTLNKQ